MKNKDILKKLYNLISSISNVYINIFVEELYENQIELHLKNKKVKKRNIDNGVRIIIKRNDEIKHKSITFKNYEEMYLNVVNYIEKELTIKLISKKKNVTFKKEKYKNINFTKQQKYRLMTEIINQLEDYDSLKISFYEKKENIFIISNSNNYILNKKNFYTKVMLKGIIKQNEIYDFILSDCGYRSVTNKKINNLINNFKKISYIKENKSDINDGTYDLILSNNCGTVFHEMLGHNLESDLVNKAKLDLFEKKNDIGNSLITFIDNTCKNNLLKVNYDDFNNKYSNKILIDNGIVKQYINTFRSESYNYYPATRMTNTYLKPNKKSLPLDYSKIKKGIYIFKISSGRLYLEEQKFKITIDAGYLIEDGNISKKIAGISFMVEIKDFISRINYVGNDLNFVPTVCGASSGNIFTFAGTPTVLAHDIYIKQL